jgi:nucleoside-diphosphate-sugar epimerase
MNAACGDSISLCDLVTMLNELLHTNIAPQFGPPRPGDVKHSLADNTRAKNLLGYTPRFSFREGLAQTVQAFQKTNKE